jgi:hypothetical protein
VLRTIAILATLLVLSAASLTTWTALQLPVEALIVPGAVDVHVVAIGWGQCQISYRAPGPPNTWYYTTAHDLESHGWVALDLWRPSGTGSAYTPIVPLRFQQLSVLIQDQVVLIPDERSPSIAHIQVHRSIVLPVRLRFWDHQ